MTETVLWWWWLFCNLFNVLSKYYIVIVQQINDWLIDCIYLSGYMINHALKIIKNNMSKKMPATRTRIGCFLKPRPFSSLSTFLRHQLSGSIFLLHFLLVSLLDCFTSCLLHFLIASRFDCFTSWLLHFLLASLRDCFTSWLLHFLIASLLAYFTSWLLHFFLASLLDCFTSCLLHFLIASLLPCFTSWLLHFLLPGLFLFYLPSRIQLRWRMNWCHWWKMIISLWCSWLCSVSLSNI